jgi:hypothetical protein
MHQVVCYTVATGPPWAIEPLPGRAKHGANYSYTLELESLHSLVALPHILYIFLLIFGEQPYAC